MCGFIATWGPMEDAPARRMLARLAHRGPDAEGWHRDPQDRFVLGHRRLSIMDPAGGDQPLHRAADDSWLVANGEIYSYPRLRQSLGDRHALATGSDSEAILHAYAERGTDVVEDLDGMYAFALSDGEHLVVARDAIGIKPLYQGRRGDTLVFASELGALAGLADDVETFPPGTIFDTRHGRRTFYEVPDPAVEDRPLDEHAAHIRRVLEEAVAKRMMSDVPVGAFLSGGLDSSIIAALIRQQVDELHTFSVGVEGSRDVEAARLVARHIGSIHHEHVFTREEALGVLPEVVGHLESFDQDLVRSALPCYFVSRLAAEHVKVIHTGEGADELFAGYTYYKDIDDDDALQEELRRSVGALHDVNLQRVDRMTMAHGLEGRVPFLDLAMIEASLRIPVRQKLPREGERAGLEKLVLRRAVEDLLPREIVWRDKEQFDEGSGTVDMLGDGLERWLAPAAAREHASSHPDAGIRSAEEAVYHHLLLDGSPDPAAIVPNVARWAERPA